MYGHLAVDERHGLCARGFAYYALAEARTLAPVHRQPTLEIGKSESGYPVSAISRTEEGKEGCVLCDREDLAVAQRPSFRRKITGEHSDFTKKRICHLIILLFSLFFDSAVRLATCR